MTTKATNAVEVCVACGLAECPAHAIPGKGLHPMTIRKGCSAHPPAGLWLVARSWATAPYPCVCAERPWVCRKGPQPGAHPGYYCRCLGRSFVAWRDTGAPEPGLPPTCCSYVFR